MISPILKYPGQVDPVSAEYPYGEARNITLPGDGLGTPWEEALANDIFGFSQAAVTEAGIVPSGNSETALTSQILNSLRIVINARTITHNIDSDANYTLTTDQNKFRRFIITDTGVELTAGRNIIVDTSQRRFMAKNSTLQTLTFKTTGGTGIAVPAGRTYDIVCDGVNVELAQTFIQASVTESGVVELATNAETITGTDTGKAVTPASLQSKVSSTTAKGIVELATNTETQTGADTERVVTPAALQSKVSSTTAKGIIELATSAEVIAGTDTTRAVTPSSLGTAAVKDTGTGAGDVILGNDSRLTDNRKCDNTFANIITSRTNLDVYSKSESDTLALAYDEAHSFTVNGYQKLSNGLIIQWGEYSTLAANSNVSINLPIVYPNAHLTASATHGYIAPTSVTITALHAETLSVSQIRISKGFNGGGAASDGKLHWFSIGF